MSDSRRASAPAESEPRRTASNSIPIPKSNKNVARSNEVPISKSTSPYVQRSLRDPVVVGSYQDPAFRFTPIADLTPAEFAQKQADVVEALKADAALKAEKNKRNSSYRLNKSMDSIFEDVLTEGDSEEKKKPSDSSTYVRHSRKISKTSVQASAGDSDEDVAGPLVASSLKEESLYMGANPFEIWNNNLIDQECKQEELSSSTDQEESSFSTATPRKSSE